MKILNYTLNNNYKYRIKLKDDTKWKDKVKTPVGFVYKSHFVEVAENDHFEDLLNFIPYLWIQRKDKNGNWVTVEEDKVEEKPKPKKSKKKSKKKSDLDEANKIEPIEKAEDDDIPDHELDDYSNIKPIERSKDV